MVCSFIELRATIKKVTQLTSRAFKMSHAVSWTNDHQAADTLRTAERDRYSVKLGQNNGAVEVCRDTGAFEDKVI